MAQENLTATFEETSIANANAAVEAYIDAICTAVGGTPTYVEINLAANINATDGNSGTYTYRMTLIANNETSTLLKDALDDLWIEFEEVCTDSSLYNTIVTVDGKVRLTVTY